MTTKTIMMAVAAAMGLAASASVIEVKFTVKTESEGKIASKVISGLYDAETGKHVFWTVEKQKNEKGKTVKVNVPYEGTYFGLVNETTVAKKEGQNAELIWGDAETPENVLVAGAWGTAKSKSGQVAGTLDGKPATGTWSAKVNTKSTYEALLAKYGLKQVENKDQGVIADLNEKIAQSADDVTKAREEADAKVAEAEAKAKADIEAAEKKAAEDIAAAKEEGEEAVKAAEKKAAEDIAAAKEQAEKDVAAAKAEGEEAVKKAQEEAQAALDAKQKELDETKSQLEQATKEMKILADTFKTIDDPDMPNMFSEYLANTKAQAKALYTEATNTIAKAELAYDDYAKSLNVEALVTDVEDAQAATNAATIALADVTATRDAIALTNDMVAVIDANGLDAFYATKLADKGSAIDAKQAELDAALADFTTYTNTLATVTIPDFEADLAARESEMNDAKTAMDESEATLEAAKTALAEFVKPTYENGGLKNFDEFIADQEAAGVTYPTEIAKQKAYEAYKDAAIATAKQPLKDAVTVAQGDFDAKKAAYNEAVRRFNEAKTNLEGAQRKLAQAIETGTLPDIETLKGELEALKGEKAKIEDEKAEWAAFKYSDDDKATFADDLVKADAAVTTAQEALDEAKAKLAVAEAALADKATTQETRLVALEAEIGATLHDAEGKALPQTDIRKAVDAFEEKYIGYRDSAEDTMNAVDGIKEKLGL